MMQNVKRYSTALSEIRPDIRRDGKSFSGSEAPRRRFGDFDVDCVSRSDLVEWCTTDIANRSRPAKVVIDINGQALSLARTTPKYRECVAKSDIIHADGGFLVTLSRLLPGPQIPERTAGTDMIHDFALHFEKTGASFFLLGGPEDLNRRCAAELLRLYPKLKITGRHHGFFKPEEEDALIAEINATQPDVVWMGLGKPLEQEVSIRWRERLDTAWIITCGGCFNYITKDYSRAPKWMQVNNLEWLHRLITNPRKLFWRYFSTSPHALWIALRQHE